MRDTKSATRETPAELLIGKLYILVVTLYLFATIIAEDSEAGNCCLRSAVSILKVLGP